MIILAGIFPKISAVFTAVPKSVLGGATLALFGVITFLNFHFIQTGFFKR